MMAVWRSSLKITTTEAQVFDFAASYVEVFRIANRTLIPQEVAVSATERAWFDRGMGRNLAETADEVRTGAYGDSEYVTYGYNQTYWRPIENMRIYRAYSDALYLGGGS